MKLIMLMDFKMQFIFFNISPFYLHPVSLKIVYKQVFQFICWFALKQCAPV